MSILRESAKNCPQCMYCGSSNPDGNLLVLAHSNQLTHGRGAYHKSQDIFGAIVCQECHDEIDGRKGGLEKEFKHEMHRIAHDRTLSWWVAEGYIVEKKPPRVTLRISA